MTYAGAFLLTVALEAALALVLVRAGLGRRVLLPVLLVNALTHPLAAGLLSAGVLPMEVIELGVVLVEALGYRAVLGRAGAGWPTAWRLALACNGVTWAVSYLV